MASLHLSVHTGRSPAFVLSGGDGDEASALQLRALAYLVERLSAEAMPTSARLAVVPTAQLAAQLSDSFRAVLFAHGFVVSYGLGGAEPNDPLTVPRFEALLDELGRNAAQRVLDLATNHQLDAEERGHG